MLKKLKLLFLPVAVIFIASAFTHAYFSDSESISVNTVSMGNRISQTSAPTSSPTPTATEAVSPARIVINEVYYDVAPGKGGDGNVADSGEWLELYNAGGSSVNLKNWTITDNTTTRIVNAANHTLGPGGYALIAKNNNIWSLYWTVPSGVEIVELGQVIGGGLSNGGDLLILKNDIGGIIDQISYGSNTSILNPAIATVAEGHSISRNPAGHDTDTASDFIDLSSPTPGGA